MNLTKNHVYNIIFWLILFIFMGYKSIVHTINVHEEGVISAYQDYKVQSQARYTFLRFIKGVDGIRPPVYAKTFELLHAIKIESNPYNYIVLNDELTLFIDQNIDKYNLSEKEYESLQTFQIYVKQESLIFNSHANSFNLLISKFPYSLLSSTKSQIKIGDLDGVEGVIVER